MAIVEVKVPQLSESVSEATLVSWHKKEGDAVSRDENLIDIETDKVVLEVPAPAAGVLAELVQADGATVAAEQVIAKIDTEGKASAAAPAQAKPAAAPAASAAPAPAPAAGGARSGVAMPAAAKLMADHQIAAGSVAGTGRDGRVTKGDVLGAIARPPAPAAAPVAAPTAVLPQVQAALPQEHLGERPEQRVPMTRLRARVAERLLQSQSSNAILTTFNEVNMAPVMEMRKRFQEKFEKEHGVKLGFMSFFVKAAVHALKKYPVINASVDGNDIVYHGYFDIGIAVGSPRGLVVPILRNADQLSFVDADHQPAAVGHPRRACDQGPRRGGERPDRGAADELPGDVVRPPHHRRPRGGAGAGGDEGSAGGSGAAVV